MTNANRYLHIRTTRHGLSTAGVHIVDSEMVKKVGHVNEKVSVRNVTMGSVEETWEGGKICELGK